MKLLYPLDEVKLQDMETWVHESFDGAGPVFRRMINELLQQKEDGAVPNVIERIRKSEPDAEKLLSDPNAEGKLVHTISWLAKIEHLQMEKWYKDDSTLGAAA